MPDNGTDRINSMQQQIEELQSDVKLLLRAQVLQGGQLQDHGSRLDRLEKLMEQSIVRGKEVDERIDKLVSAIGALNKEIDERIDKLVSAIGVLNRDLQDIRPK
jgi:chromosome segregation ATPase